MSTLEFSQLLGNYGEFIGAIAIVVTLIYLAMQLRQNTRAIQSSERAYRSNLEVATNGRFLTSVETFIQTRNCDPSGLEGCLIPTC